MTWWEAVLRALWLFLPAYLANMAPVFVAKLAPRWNTPIDGGRTARDGRRLLGAGKTWRGLAGGALFGAIAALGLALASPHWDLVYGLDYGLHTCPPEPGEGGCHIHAARVLHVVLFGAAMGFFALAGDAVKSYFKRRLGKEGGAPWVPFDQLDFVVFGILGMLAFAWLLPPGWVWSALTDDWVTLATLLLLTPILHFVVNVVGFALRLKKVPW